MPVLNYFRYRRLSRRTMMVALSIFLALLVGVIGLFSWLTRMAGKSFHGELPALTTDQKTIADELQRDLEHLAITIGERNVSRKWPQLEESAQWIEDELRKARWAVERQEYEVEGRSVRNIIAGVQGSSAPEEIVVIGAHYDSVVGCPGANDNGSGVVSLLALARRLGPAVDVSTSYARTLRLVFFVNEEPPWFQHDEMGSLVYAKQCRQRDDKVVAMLSLETMGYYSDEPHSQEYPLPILGRIYPTTGNFIGFIGSTQAAGLVRQCVGLFRDGAKFPSEGAAIPSAVQGVAWSDHWSFETQGYPGVMVTDTAPFRFPYYHTPEDTPDKVDYERLARATDGLLTVVEGLSGTTAE